MRRPLLALALLVAPLRAAWADCDVPYTASMVTEDLGQMNLALRSLDVDTFGRSAARLDAHLPCLTELLPVPAYASAYRFLGAWHYLQGDPDTGTRWFRTALELDPVFDWDVGDLPDGHPIRRAFDGERAIAAQPAVALEGMVLDPPSGTAVYLDGRPLAEPAATTGRPHLVQVVGEGGTTARQGWKVDGNDLPESLLLTEEAAAARAAALAAAAAADDKPRKRKPGPPPPPEVRPAAEDDADLYAVKVVQARRSPAKVPLIVTGAAGLVAGGVLYGLSFPAHDRFEAATTTDEMLAAQTATNTLVVAGGAAVAVGLGVGVLGVQLDSHPGLILRRRF